MTKRVNFKIDDEEQKKIDALKPFAKSSTRSKVFKFALNKAYELYKDVKP